MATIHINIKYGSHTDGLEMYQDKSTQITAQGLRKEGSPSLLTNLTIFY